MATWDSRANELFLSALDRPPADRPSFLDSACAGDAVVRARVEALLAAAGQARGFLERPALVIERPEPERLGPYKLLQKIGEGGMGAVWMAEQAEPVRRTVALKVIRTGSDSAHVTARFEAERQALALMDHPNIAKVFDTGATPDGRPFFVMELVKGVPITTFCDDRQLPVAERLGLFVHVCRAVHHAHQKGVIHRDIKPSNVLVALYDGRPVPKVIDFGLAKATGPKLTEKTLFTEFGTIIGTLEYMSPEQAELNQLDVDTRTDVYSLGVLLYELLTGTTPLERQKLGAIPLLEVLRQVREGDTPRPSTRLSTANTLPTIAAARGIDPRHLAGLLKGELDWIALTALEKDRERRYESPAALAADVERYLRDDTVQACPPALGYRVRKFARRHRRGLVASAATGLVLAVAMGSVGWALWDRAARKSEAAADARTTAERELDKIDVLLGARKRADAEAAWERAASAAASAPTDALAGRLAEARERLDAAARDEAFVAGYEALLLEIDARSYEQDTNIHFKLEPNARRADELLTRYGLGADTDPLAASALVRSRPPEVRWYVIAALYTCAADPQGSDRFARVLEMVDSDPWRVALRGTFGRDDDAAVEKLARDADPRQQPPAVLLVAVRRATGGAPRAALELLRRSLAVHPGDVWLNAQAGFNLVEAGEPDKAVPYLTAALALRPHHQALLLLRAQAFRAVKRPTDALADAEEAVAVDPQSAVAHGFLSRVLQDRKDAPGAEAAARRALAINPNSWFAHLELGNALRLKKDAPGALAAYRAAATAAPKSADAHASVGLALQDLGDRDGAIKAFRTAAEVGPRHSRCRLNLGMLLWVHKKDADGAVAALREALVIDPTYAAARSMLVRVLVTSKRTEAVLAEARKGVESAPQSALAHEDLGLAFQVNNQPDEAHDAFRKAVFLDPSRPSAQLFLGTAHGLKKEYRAAADCFRRVTVLDPSNVKGWTSLGVVLKELNDMDGAVGAFRAAAELTPKVAAAHSQLGDALGVKGDTAAAIEAFRAAARLDPQHPNALWNVATLSAQLKRWPDARAGFAEGIRAFPNDPRFHFQYGLLSVLSPDPKLDDPRAAETAGRKLISLGQPANGWALVAWAEYRKGEWTAAVAAMEKLLAAEKPPASELTPLRGYLMALAHAKLGDATEARKWYDKAAAAKGDWAPEVVARAKAEAAELLGIDPPPKK